MHDSPCVGFAGCCYPPPPDCHIQLCRSVGPWSIGVATETSIEAAYVHLIETAQHFVYIENQYFISSTSGNSVQNKIADTLMKRICTAIETG